VATVTIRGSGRAAAQPDEVQVQLGASVTRATADEAWAEVTRRAEALRAIFDDCGVPPERRLTAGVMLVPAWEHDGKGRRHNRGFQALTSVRLRLDSAERLGELLRRAVEEADAEFGSPAWSVRDDNPARLDACRAAAAQAQARAAAYADALGLRLGAVVAVREPGTEEPKPMVHLRAMAAAAETSPMPIDSGEIDVIAEVEVTFALEPR
jgi:uncharacterized protein YggE